MPTISHPDFDQLVEHTIRVELKDSSTLLYRVSVEAKTAFFSLLKMDAISDNENGFLWVSIPQDRLVLINKKEIIRITFCFDPPTGQAPQYYDNFDIVDNFEQPSATDTDPQEVAASEMLCLPQLIIAHRRQKENMEIVKGVTMESEGYFGNISSYSNLNKGDVEGFDFEYFDDEKEWYLLTYKYLQFIDDDGEENFMPLENLSVIEIDRPLIMSDELIDLYLDRKTDKKRRPKKK